MNRQAPPVALPRRVERDGLRPVMRASFAVHVAAVVVMFLLPRSWFQDHSVQPPTMSISLGAAGPRTSGMNAAGARPVEEVAPPPKRPEPARPATPKDEAAVASVKTTKTPPKPAPAEPQPTKAAPARAPITGAQVTPGTSRAETGATGQGTGLAGGGGAGAQADVSAPDFCCPDYVEEMRRRIVDRWRRNQQEVGTVVLTFVIHRDGRFTDLKTTTSPSSILEYHARNAFNGLLLPPLPQEYKDQTLTVRLTFNYVR